MNPIHLLEFLDAAHLTQYVESPYKQRGGIMIVGPPNSMKSTFIEMALAEYPNRLILSDINVNTLTQIKDDLASGTYPTIAFPAFEKLYQRNPSTASNIEGYLMALVEEGFSRASFEDQRMAAIKARTLVIGAIPYAFYQSQYARWAKSGFLRRFLWVVIRLSDPEKIMDAIHNWELIPFEGISHRVPPSRTIKYSMKSAESKLLRSYINEQPPGNSTPYVLIKKIACALRWKYSTTTKPNAYQAVLKGMHKSFSREGTEITL